MSDQDAETIRAETIRAETSKKIIELTAEEKGWIDELNREAAIDG